MFNSIVLLSTNRLVLIGIIFLTDIALARIFGPNGKGTYNYFIATVITLATVLSLGLNYGYLNATRSRTRYELSYFRIISILILSIATLPLIVSLWPGYQLLA